MTNKWKSQILTRGFVVPEWGAGTVLASGCGADGSRHSELSHSFPLPDIADVHGPNTPDKTPTA